MSVGGAVTCIPMNLGIDVRTLMSPTRTGVGEYAFELLSAVFSLPSEDQFYLLYNGQRKATHYLPRWNQPNVHSAGTGWPNKIFNATTALARWPFLTSPLAPEKKLDAVFLPHINFTALPPGTKYVVTVHDLTFRLFPQFFSAKQRLWHHLAQPERLIRNAAHIITPSDATRRDVIEQLSIPESRVTTVYPGLASNVANPTEADSNRVIEKYHLPSRFILFLGTIEPRKNIVGLLEAFVRLQKTSQEFNDVELVIAGADGWLNKEIHQTISRTPQVRSIGFVSPADKPALYKLARVFVYPSFYEGFGFPVLEAMAAGTPVITSNRSSLPEITRGAALLVDPYAVHEMAEAIRWILSDEKLHDWYRTKGLENVKKFSWHKSAREFLEIMRKF